MAQSREVLLKPLNDSIDTLLVDLNRDIARYEKAVATTVQAGQQVLVDGIDPATAQKPLEELKRIKKDVEAAREEIKTADSTTIKEKIKKVGSKIKEWSLGAKTWVENKATATVAAYHMLVDETGPLPTSTIHLGNRSFNIPTSFYDDDRRKRAFEEIAKVEPNMEGLLLLGPKIPTESQAGGGFADSPTDSQQDPRERQSYAGSILGSVVSISESLPDDPASTPGSTSGSATTNVQTDQPNQENSLDTNQRINNAINELETAHTAISEIIKNQLYDEEKKLLDHLGMDTIIVQSMAPYLAEFFKSLPDCSTDIALTTSKQCEIAYYVIWSTLFKIQQLRKLYMQSQYHPEQFMVDNNVATVAAAIESIDGLFPEDTSGIPDLDIIRLFTLGSMKTEDILARPIKANLQPVEVDQKAIDAFFEIPTVESNAIYNIFKIDIKKLPTN